MRISQRILLFGDVSLRFQYPFSRGRIGAEPRATLLGIEKVTHESSVQQILVFILRGQTYHFRHRDHLAAPRRWHSAELPCQIIDAKRQQRSAGRVGQHGFIESRQREPGVSLDFVRRSWTHRRRKRGGKSSIEHAPRHLAMPLHAQRPSS